MAVGEARDNTQDWLLPDTTRALSFAQLESRVHFALSLAQASEAGVREVGAAAVEAAEQARQAAELAKQAANAAQAAALDAEAARAASVSLPAPEAAPVVAAAAVEEDWLIRFTHRAERLSARLVKLQHA